MKRVEKFLRAYPSYTKWGSNRIAVRLNLTEKTVERFKKTDIFKQIKTEYAKTF